MASEDGRASAPPSNQRLERTGAQTARHGRAAVGACRSTAGRYVPLACVCARFVP